MSRDHYAELTDAELIAASRGDDSHAFAELWRRHYNAGKTVARSITSSLDADDLVQESYTRIYQAILKGGGPTGAFRPYLFTTIRNTAATWGRRNNESALDMLDALEDPSTNEEASTAALDRSLTSTAFRSLPTRWQEIIWYSEVERMTPAQIGPLVGMSANAVAALSYRAREGLRQAWIQAHLQNVPEGTPCHWATSRLGQYARGNLGERDRARLEAHLDECSRCTIVAAEAKEASSRIALGLLPLAVGSTGAGGYLAWLQTAGPAGSAAAATMPPGVTAATAGAAGTTAAATSAGGAGASGTTSGGAGGAGTAGGGAGASGAGASGGNGIAGIAAAGASSAARGIAVSIGVAAAAATIVTVVALTSAPGAPIPTAGTAGSNSTTETTTPPRESATPGGTGPEGTDATEDAEKTPTPDAPVDTTDSAAGTGSQMAKPTPDATQAPVAPAPSPTPTTPPAPTPTPPPDPTPTPTTPPVTPPKPTTPQAPRGLSDTRANDGLYPSVSGTAVAGSDVEIFADGASVARVRTGGDGVFRTGQLTAIGHDGTVAITARQSTQGGTSPLSAPLSARIVAPGLDYIPRHFLHRHRFAVTGVPGATVQLTDGGAAIATLRLDQNGNGEFRISGSVIPRGWHDIGVSHIDPASPGSQGPAVVKRYDLPFTFGGS